MSDDERSGLENEAGGMNRGSLLKRLALGGAALSVPSMAAVEAAMAAPTAATATVFPKHPKWKFAFINHVTTNPFFVPTQYGAADAAKMLDVELHVVGLDEGRRRRDDQRVQCGDQREGRRHRGLRRRQGRVRGSDQAGARPRDPRRRLQRRRRPAGAKARIAYIGQDLYVSGFEMGKRIVELVPSGDVALFIATPGALNIQPRIDGAIAAIKASGKPVKATAVPTSPDLATELSMIDAYYQGHKSLKGMFAVDAGDTQGVGQVIQKYQLQNKVKGGGYDLLPGTLKLIQNGSLQFTIDQQPYLQGFYPVLQLFLQKLSGGLVAPSDTNTGLLFVTKANVKPYLNTKTRYHGSSNAHKYPVS